MDILEVKQDPWALARLVEEPMLRDGLAGLGFEHLGYLFVRVADLAEMSDPAVQALGVGLTYEYLHLPGEGVSASVERVGEVPVVELSTWLADGAQVVTSYWAREPDFLGALTRAAKPGAAVFKEGTTEWQPDALLARHRERVRSFEAARGTERLRDVELAHVVASMVRGEEVATRVVRSLLPTAGLLLVGYLLFAVVVNLIGQVFAGLLPYSQVVWFAACMAGSLIVLTGSRGRRMVIGLATRLARVPTQPPSHYLEQPTVVQAMGDHHPAPVPTA